MYCKPAVKKSDLLKMDPSLKLLTICLIMSTLITVYGQVKGTSGNDVVSGREYPFHLTYSPVKVYPIITNTIELRCARDKSVSTNIEELIWIRIMKKVDRKWKVLAEMSDRDSHVHVDGSVKSSGFISVVKDAYLSVLWPVVTQETFGLYKCLAFGLDQEASLIADETAVVDLRARKMQQRPLLNLILETRQEVQKIISDNFRQIDKTNKSLDELTMQSDTKFSDIRSRLDQSDKALGSLTKNFIFPNAEDIWPAGDYALLKPDTGCPMDLAFYDGNTGYFKIHTQSSSLTNENKYSQNNHMSKPITTSYSINKFLTLRFCVTNNIFNTGSWPDGRYCIHKKGNCPAGLKAGHILLDTEDSGNLDAKGGNTPDTRPDYLSFCCKTTGNPMTPIVFPKASPFYLYQYDGRCQRVQGMKATTEYFQVDTEPGPRNKKSGYPPYTIDQPEGLMRLDLCYYTKL